MELVRAALGHDFDPEKLDEVLEKIKKELEKDGESDTAEFVRGMVSRMLERREKDDNK
jgi:hypothetical protein